VLLDENRGNTVVWELRGLNAELSHLPVDNINIHIEREREKETTKNPQDIPNLSVSNSKLHKPALYITAFWDVTP
jgi:hypothetical protein